jgi:hypothetical protein
MIRMKDRALDAEACRTAVDEFDKLLSSRDEIEESGPNGLLEFFSAHPDLLILMGDLLLPSLSPTAYQKEFSILGEFRADFAVANKNKSKFVFIEFESAERESVFVQKGSSPGTISYEWARRFEHGYSQVVDWHYRLDDLSGSSKFYEHFGHRNIEFEGVLVVGRDKFVQEAKGEERLKWRKEHTLINNRKLRCMTFDLLLSEMRGRLEFIADILNGRL